MSSKDTRYKRQCPICADTLPGTDDGKMVYDCLKEAVEAIDSGEGTADDMGCTLCGEDVSEVDARRIIAKGEPTLLTAQKGEFDE